MKCIESYVGAFLGCLSAIIVYQHRAEVLELVADILSCFDTTD